MRKSRISYILFLSVLLVACQRDESLSQERLFFMKETLENDVYMTETMAVGDVVEMYFPIEHQINSAKRRDKLVYAYFRENVEDISEEDFALQWKIHYLDITGEGNDEICLENRSGNVPSIFLRNRNESLEQIPSTGVVLATGCDLFSEGAILVAESTFNNGSESGRCVDLYVYNGIEIVSVNRFWVRFESLKKPGLYGRGKLVLINGYESFDYIYDQYMTLDGEPQAHISSVFLNYRFNRELATYDVVSIGENFDYSDQISAECK